MRYTIKQKVISLKETFHVTDEEGAELYEVSGKMISIGHKLTIRDMEGNEVAYIHQKVLSLTPKYFIEIAGQDEMELRSHITLLRPHYTLETPEGDWDIRGDFIGHEYEMKRDGEAVAAVTQKYLTWGDTYVLDVENENDALAALCTMIVIDCVISDTNAAVSRTVAEN